jgi:uncharacterized protein YecE (DUF72 family)
MTPDNRADTLKFLTDHQLTYVCVDMPQGYPSSVPPVLAATTPELAVVRLHGHSEKWSSKDIQDRFDYCYSAEEIRAWAARIRTLSVAAEVSHVVFNNTYRGYGQANAEQLAALLAAERAS